MDDYVHLPQPRDLAEQLLARAWDDDADVGVRLLLEPAALTIQSLVTRLTREREHREARSQ